MDVKSSTRREARGGRVIFPALVGCLIAGVVFVGIAFASQHQVRAPISATGPDAMLRSADGLVGEPIHTPDPAMAEALSRSVPVTLEIPTIDVRSNLQSLGLEEGGGLETPAGDRYDEAGWYRHSPTPGSMGPAIILGHVDSYEGPSVFFRLGELTAGDKVTITRADDSIARFIVDSVHSYPKHRFPTDEVYGDIDHAGLRLITCGGIFDEGTGHYEDNIVVYARLDVSDE